MAHYDAATYEVEIVGQGFSESAEKKTPYCFLEFRPTGMVNQLDTEGPLIVCDAKYTRQVKLWVNSEKNVDRMIERLAELFDWDGRSFSDIDPSAAGENLISFTGRRIYVECSHQQFDGKTYENWDLPFGGNQESTESQAGLAHKLDALYGRQLKKTSKPVEEAKPAEEAAPPSQQTVPTADEIPF